MLSSADPFLATPAGSIIGIADEQKVLKYITALNRLPKSILTFATSMETSASIRGTLKQYQLSVEQAPTVAFAILEILLGYKQIAQLPVIISSELKIANDKAQKIAQEIERDLFAPISLELNRHLAQKKQKAGGMAEKLGVTLENNQPAPQRPPGRPANPSPSVQRKPASPPNILNLKYKKGPPSPPPIPR